MSTLLFYRPIMEGGTVVPNATSSVIKALTETFGALPLYLSEAHLDRLRAMSWAAEGENNPYAQLAKAIEELGTIQLYVSV